MQDIVVDIKKISVKRGDHSILNNISLPIRQGEQWAIMGGSGSGKTTLAHALTGEIFYTGEIKMNIPVSSNHSPIILVEQQHHFKTLSNTSDFYYQQRYNSFDAEDSITVGQALHSLHEKDKWVALLHLTPLLSKPLIQLSNGENKRLQLAKALSRHPQLLILDNPFIGLDVEGRQTLHTILDNIVKEKIHLLLISSVHEIPDCISHIAVLEKGELVWQGKKEEHQSSLLKKVNLDSRIIAEIKKLSSPAFTSFTNAVYMLNVHVQYGEKIILQQINWQVKKGECWSVSGPNGAGKSTLLSLISADNPQAYANEIYLFDKRRGSGESIWDIKKLTGYVSPELHLFFEQHNTCFEVIASGLFDTIGLFRQLTAEQETKVHYWIQLMQLEKLTYRSMFQLSNSEQRMVLLARALIKNPPLLILDEPCQGLDEQQTIFFTQLVNEICTQLGTTLIYVSHYAKDIPACVTHFLQLEDGRIKKAPALQASAGAVIDH
ncbi:MAG: ATP-binding cassette domain-containing protein [Sphingobacteriales bacterium]|nr:ATP-binding cassette domain-containing protein [Sphingobacteriales bacterium]